MEKKLKVGDPVWICTRSNRGVEWQELKIDGETKVSWIIKRPLYRDDLKVEKKTLTLRETKEATYGHGMPSIFFDTQAVEDEKWLQANVGRIKNEVDGYGRMYDAQFWREIDEALKRAKERK